MEKKEYSKIVNKYKPKENRVSNALISFLVGGFMGILAQFITDSYILLFDITDKMASTYMIVTLIFFACLFTSLGLFDKWVNFAKCGLIIPITGFAHSMMSTTLEYKREGIVTGMGANMFKLAGTVIMSGVVSAYFFGLLRVLIMGG